MAPLDMEAVEREDFTAKSLGSPSSPCSGSFTFLYVVSFLLTLWAVLLEHTALSITNGKADAVATLTSAILTHRSMGMVTCFPVLLSGHGL